jgi:hypothetical protein
MTSTQDSFDTMSTAHVLSTPLLASQHEGEYDEEVCLRGSKSNDDTSSQEGTQDEKSDSEKQTTWWFASCAISIVVSALLSLEFGIVFYTFPVEVKATTGLCWSLINFCIVLNVIIIALYRQSIKNYGMMPYAVTLLLPELLMDIMLCLVHFDKVVAAFWLLLGSMMCLTVFVVGSKFRLLSVVTSTSTDSDTVDPQDEFAVSL